jgi:hypothetical protein
MIRRLCRRLIALIAAAVLPSCSDTPAAPSPQAASPAPIVGVSLSPREATLAVGSTVALNAVVTNSSDTRVTFRSSDPAIAAVGETGIVTCLAPGLATVEARSMADPGMSSSATITCTPASDPEPLPVEGLSIDVSPRSLSLSYAWTAFCPMGMDIGTFTVLNNGGVTAEIEILSGQVRTTRYMFPLPPGESRDVGVFHHCFRGDVETTIRVIARAGGEEIVRNVRVSVTIQ